MPAMRVIYFNYIDMTQMYIILLTLWFPCAIFSIKIIKSANLEKKIIIGNVMQLISFGLCLISISIGSGILYIFFMLLMFLANMIMQPVFFSYLGLYSKNSLYTLGMQSGIYVFITTIILAYTVFINIEMEKIMIGFASLLILSVINSITFVLIVNRGKNNK
ncbi:hypothetical protein L7G72_14480 [Xenorhabdus bovienii]|nr:hypothetical protein [Xenorhabdus bovienii]MCG3463030.1 hypothetical protein [Xenorhabdus bovienii]